MDGDKETRRGQSAPPSAAAAGEAGSSGDEGASASSRGGGEGAGGGRTSSEEGGGGGGCFGISWPVIAALIFLGMIFQYLLAKRVLREVGVTDTDSFNEFLRSTVLPQVETGLMMINGSLKPAIEANLNRPGKRLAREGAKAKYPVVLVPGFVTSGLELWAGEECAQKHFRTRLWGSMSMAQTFFADRECWRRHLSLDPRTGSDPDGVRLRAAQGFEAADYFMATFWVWDRVISNLADVGYDASNMVMMSYDWRLAFPKLEERDGYLTKLRHSIEAFVETTGEKVVLASHSMGGTLVLYFFAWVTTDRKDGGGGGGEDWVEKHVHSFVNIAGALLGVPKAVPALLSGEVKDTAVLLGALGDMLEKYFGRKVRMDMFNTWGSLWAMLPKGGDAIWGVGADICDSGDTVNGLSCESQPASTVKETTSEDKPEQIDTTMSPLVMMPDPICHGEQEENVTGNVLREVKANATVSGEPSPVNDLEAGGDGTCPANEVKEKIVKLASTSSWSVEDTIDYLLKWGGGYGPDLSASELHSFSSETVGQPSKEQWHDPTVTPLPSAPSLKLYCLYGFGIPTERGYYYKKSCNGHNNSDSNNGECSISTDDPPIILDSSVNDEVNNVTYGVRFTEGDVSVPLLSLGYMCVDGWKGRSRLNPSGLEVTTREYQHAFEFQANDPIRGGPRSAEHCDILGNVDMLEDFLRIATDHDSLSVQTRIQSNIEQIAERINAHPLGGLKAAKGEKSCLGFGE